VETTLFAQVVLTLRCVFFGRDELVLITTEWNRIYAITNKNPVITSCFSVIMVSQFILGLYLIVFAAMRGGEFLNAAYVSPTVFTYFNVSAETFPQIPLPVYVLCNFVGRTFLDIAYNALSLAYGRKLFVFHPDGEAHSDHPPDLLTFSVIIYLVVRSNVYKVPIPSLLRTIAEDATYYFLVIFTSQLVFVMFVVFANVGILS